MNIHLGQGIDDYYFGATESQIVKRLGKPDRLYQEDKETDYEYDELKITFRFYENHANKLGWIETENQNATLFKNRIIGLEESQIIDILELNNIDDIEIDEYQTFKTLYSQKTILEIEITYGAVSRLKFGVFINEDNQYIWPENKDG